MKKGLFKKITFSFGGIVLALMLIFTVIFNVTPNITANFLRSTFKNPGYTKPAEYAQYEAAVTKKADLKYESKIPDNTFDVYMPKDTTKDQYPTIVWPHGGAFVGGDKIDLTFYATSLAARGYVVVTMNYQLAPEGKYPGPIMQMGDLMNFLPSIAQEYRMDLDNIALMGDSAGAQMAAQFTMAQVNETYRKEANLPQVIDPKKIKATILYCGPYDFKAFANGKSAISRFIFGQVGWAYIGEKNWVNSEEAKYASIVDFPAKNFPPTYITDGNTASFEEQGLQFLRNLSTNDVKVKSRFFDPQKFETKHEFQFQQDTEPGKLVYADTIKFLEDVFSAQTPEQ